MKKYFETLGSSWREQFQRFRLSISASSTAKFSPFGSMLFTGIKMAVYQNFSTYEDYQKYRLEQKKLTQETMGDTIVQTAKPPTLNFLALIWPPNYARAILLSVRFAINLAADKIKNPTVRKVTKAIFGFLPFLGELILYPITVLPSKMAYEKKQANVTKKSAKKETEEAIEMRVIDEKKEEPVEDWVEPKLEDSELSFSDEDWVETKLEDSELSFSDEAARQVVIPETKERTNEAAKIDIFIRNMKLEGKPKQYIKENMKELLEILNPQDEKKAANIAEALVGTYNSKETRGEQLLKVLNSLRNFPPTGKKVIAVIEKKMQEVEALSADENRPVAGNK